MRILFSSSQSTLCVCVRARACLVTQSFPNLCNPMDYSPPGSFVHGDSAGKNTGVWRRERLPTPVFWPGELIPWTV